MVICNLDSALLHSFLPADDLECQSTMGGYMLQMKITVQLPKLAVCMFEQQCAALLLRFGH